MMKYWYYAFPFVILHKVLSMIGAGCLFLADVCKYAFTKIEEKGKAK